MDLGCNFTDKPEWRCSNRHGVIFPDERTKTSPSLHIINLTKADSCVYICNDFPSGKAIIEYNVTVKGDF